MDKEEIIHKEVDKESTTIATHNGSFHADDIFAVATLVLMLEKKHDVLDIKIVRTRDMDKISVADYVVDVGGIYDPLTRRFDHHQSGRAGARSSIVGGEQAVPYAAFGLVWKEYGAFLVEESDATDNSSVGNSSVGSQYIDHKLVMPIDAQDNGIEISTPKIEGVSPYSMDDIARAFRTTSTENEEELDTRFAYLVDFAKKLIEREILKVKDKISGSAILQKIYDTNIDKTLIILDKGMNFSLSMLNIPDAVLLIFPDGLSDNWCIDTIKVKEGSFVARKFFPQNWGGKRDQELEEVTEVKGAVFCHTGLFFAVAKTKEAAVAMARAALL